MDGLSIVILLLILVGFLAAIRSIWRNRNNPCSGCSGDCSSCDTSSRAGKGEKPQEKR